MEKENIVSNLDVVVLIPCYNEESTIKKVINDFRLAVPSALIYVYDNASTDDTAKVARGAGAIAKGVGSLAKTGAQAAGTAFGATAADKIITPIRDKLAKGQVLAPDEKKIASKIMSDKDVKEGVEEQSELILAAKDMMDKVTGYLEDLATMKTESMLELADRIRDEMGAEKSDAFLNKVKPAIEQAETTLGQTRQELDNSVRILTGEEVETDTIGPDDTMNTEPNADTDLDSLEGPETDEFGAADAEAGGTEPEGRLERESREVFEQSNRIYSKLARK